MTQLPLEALMLLIKARRLIAERKWHAAYVLLDQAEVNAEPYFFRTAPTADTHLAGQV